MRPAFRAGVVIAALAAVTTAVPAQATPSRQFESGETVTMIVEFGQISQTARAADRSSISKDALPAQAERAGFELTAVRRFDTLLNGMAVQVDAMSIDALGDLPGVTAVYPVNTYEPPRSQARQPGEDTSIDRENVTVTDLTGVPEAHQDGATGEGVTVGIIDSGIDYNHAELGGGGFPNDKVVGGYDIVDQDPDPFDELSGAMGHGTHVAGILAGNGDKLVGVAKDATIRSYRVFGESRPTTDDVVIEALERAVEDGVDVVNLSLGQSQSQVHQNAVLPLVLDSVAERGVIPVVAIGNGYSGPFKPGSPGIAKQAITVGSVYSNGYTHLAMTLRSGETVPYNEFVTGPTSPASGSAQVVSAGGAVCEPAEPGSFAGMVVLATSDWYPCTPTSVVANIQAGGAVGVLYFDDSEFADPAAIPGANFWGEASDIPAVAIRRDDADLIQERLDSGEQVDVNWGGYWRIGVQDEFAGLPDASSSWGPSHELDYKPDVVAPGGYVFSTLPKKLGYYGVNSGTSMAAPHVAGAVAVLLAAKGDMTSAQMRDLLQSTARPTQLSGAPQDGLHQVAQQGAGLIDLPAALAATTTVSPAKLPLGELEGTEATRTVTLTNQSRRAVVYDIDTQASLGAAPPYTAEYQTVEADAKVTLTKNKVTVPPRKSVKVTVTITEPKDVVDGTVFGGWVTFDARKSDKDVKVSYMGIAGDWHKVSAFNPTFSQINPSIDNPSLRPAYFSFGRNEPLTITDPQDSAWLMVSLGFPMFEEIRMDVLDSEGNVVATPVSATDVVRNSGAGTGMEFLNWDTLLPDGTTAPNGDYNLRLSFVKSLDNGPTETWTSPVITLAR